MAARWGAGEETLTIGGMELFTAGGPLQCQAFEDDGPCGGLSDLSLSTLDSGGILGSFQGYIDTSLISVIEDPSTQNSDTFDDENELSLLTALTEILDNTDDENLSPFDTIPDTELLVSTKDREGAALQKFLGLSRTPPELENSLLDEQRRPGSCKTDRSAALNWEQCLEGISSTPKRRNKLKSLRGCMSLVVRKEPTQQRSDGEEEELASPDKAIEEGSDMIFDKDLMGSPLMKTDLEQDALLTQSTPCVINTENVTLHDLVKYMHPYCLPALTVCLDEVDDNLENAVFLEIVSEQGDCIKVPVIMEHPEEALDCEKDIDFSALELLNSELGVQTDIVKESPEELQPVEQPSDDKPSVTTSLEKLINHENSDNHDLQILESREKEPDVVVVVEDKNMNPSTDKLEEAMEVSAQENNEPDSSAQNRPDDNSINQKKIKRNKQPESCKSKTKCKSMNKNSNKGQTSVEKVTVQKTVPSTLKRTSSNSLQESDFLIKQLDQAKKDSQMELRSLRVTRSKLRNRGNLDNAPSSEKKLSSDDRKLEKMKSNEKEASKPTGRNPWVEPNNSNSNEPGAAERPRDAVLVPGSDNKNVAPEEISAASDVQMEETSAVEEKKPSSEGVSTTFAKDVKPKSLSLSEYRKRLQHRKPNTGGKGCESVSESKWPSIPEPPTELAEIPCLIVPGKDALPSKSIKIPPSVGENRCSSAKAPIPSGQDVPSNLVSAPSTSQPVFTQQQMQPEAMASSVMVTNSYTVPLQPNVPPPFYPPTWPVSSHPAYYPTLPTLPTVSLFPNCLPPDPLHAVTMQPPMVSWPPFPPPPIAMGAVHSSDPAGWPPGYQPSYWQPPVVQPEIAGDPPLQPSAGNVGTPVTQVLFSSASNNVQQQVKISQNAQGPPKSNRQTVQPSRQMSRTPPCETTGSAEAEKPVKGNLKQNKSPVKSLENRTAASVKRSCSLVPKTNPSPSKPVVNQLPKIPPDPLPTLPSNTKTSALAPDSKSANQVVFKILALLRKAQSKVVDMKPTPETSGSAEEPLPASLDPPARVEPDLRAKTATQHPETSSAAAKLSALVSPATTPAAASALSAVESKYSEQVALDKPPTGQPPKIEDDKQQARAPASPETLLPGTGTGVRLSLPDADKCRGSAGTFTSEKGIEATDLTSLLEQFEQSEAKDDRVPQSPDFKLAVGNSGSEKPTEKKVHDRLLAPELASTAGLTPPATPPHQLWKTVAVGSAPGKSKSLLPNIQGRTCPSPIKTTKLIDAQPLPQSKLRNRNPAPATKSVLQPVHVASGDHDYCILSSSSQPEKFPVPDQPQGEPSVPATSSSCEGSRWNVKHHPNITIKPIVQFNKKPADRACQKLPKPTTASTAPSGVLSQSVSVPCNAVPKELLNQLDHRTNCGVQAAEAQPGSVFMSPDSSPCRSENWDAGTGVGRDNSSVSRRSLRCYRKYSASQSPETSVPRGRRSSRSHSSSSSSSRSRSRTPPSKRKRYSSRSQRSQSSSRSRSSTRSTSSSSSASSSSRSFSPSSSRSRPRSRSRSRQRYRSRSRRYESRESHNRQRMVHKERAIEERRVVYIGKINNQMTRSELKHRFSVFGDIDECTIHFREHGDNYGFVTYHNTREAFTAIENGHKLRLPDELPFDLCFGGRRQFCKRNYADLDSYPDEFSPSSTRNKYEELDFDTLLKQAQKNRRR